MLSETHRLIRQTGVEQILCVWQLGSMATVHSVFDGLCL